MKTTLETLVVSAFAFASITFAPTAEAANPTGFWKCRARARTLLLVILPNGRLSLEGSPSMYRVNGNRMSVVMGGRWVNVPFRVSGRRGRRRLSATISASGLRFSCREIPAGREGQLRGQMCSYSGGSSYYAGTSSSSSRRVTFDGRGRFVSNYESSYGGPRGSGYYRRGGDKRGYYRIYGNKVIVVLASGAAAIATVYRRYGNRIGELKYAGRLYGAALCK
jgi:hypothetical protein